MWSLVVYLSCWFVDSVKRPIFGNKQKRKLSERGNSSGCTESRFILHVIQIQTK